MTDEAEGVAQPYVTKNKMEFLVAVGGGANGYQTRGIPAAWLVAPNGKIVWKGHPSQVKNDMIEKHIKDVILKPKFKLSKDLKRANKHLNAGSYGKGLVELEKVIAKTDDDSVITEAKDAIAKVNQFGEEELNAVEDYAKAGFYIDAMSKLKGLTKSFKGTALGDRATTKYDEWKKDKTIKLEIDGAETIAAAKELMNKAKYKDAARALAKITKSKKYNGTKAQSRAQDLLDEVMKKL